VVFMDNDIVDKVLKIIGITTKEEALAHSISEMTDESKIHYFTYLYPLEDENIAELLEIAEDYKLDFLRKEMIYFLKLRCSLLGWRSKQFENIIREGKKPTEKTKKLLSRLRRKKETEE